jgi:hypothetical protein
MSPRLFDAAPVSFLAYLSAVFRFVYIVCAIYDMLFMEYLILIGAKIWIFAFLGIF